MPMSEILIKTSELMVASGGKTLMTLGVGSCVVACMWDPAAHIGGMVHMPLPCGLGNPCEQYLHPGVAPESALPFMLELMEQRGARREQINVRLIGGGNMFDGIEEGLSDDIGTQILRNARHVIDALGLVVSASAVGGRLGRNVSFSIETGQIVVQTTDGNTERI